jgi:hypothetical protein
MTRENLNRDVVSILNQYANNLLGDADLIHLFGDLKEKYNGLELADQIDLNTGLRFPAGYKL